jgi:vitamin B12 transporter
MKKILLTALFFLFLAAPLLAGAADNEEKGNPPAQTLDEMVVTATRSREKIETIPAKVEVINQLMLESTVAETLTEQLKKNASISVIEYPGALAGIGIRGFRPEFSGITKHSLILVNGRPAGATNLATILSDNVERIEVLKGPASSLYGAEAMGGVVNIITKKSTGNLNGRAEFGMGSFDTNFQKASLGGSLNQWFDFDISGRHFNQVDDLEMGNGHTRPNTGYDSGNGNMRIGANLGENWRADAGYDLYFGRDIETPGDLFNGDTKSGHKDLDRHGYDFTLSGELSPDNTISLTAYKTRESADYYKHYIGWSKPVQVEPFRSYDYTIDWWGVQAKDEHSWRGHRFIIGIDYQDIDKENRSFNQDGSRKAPYSPDESRENWAGYLETIWKFFDRRLTLTAGARYDTFDVKTHKTPYKTDFHPGSETFSTWSPRAGINYLCDSGLRLHATIGQAFVPPTAAQLAGYSERVVGGVVMITKGNSNLDPETSTTYDFGIGYKQPDWGLAFDITYFHTDVDDKISRVKIGNITTYENSLDAEMDGLETMFSFDLGALMRWNRTLEFYLNSTYMFDYEEDLPNGQRRDIYNVAEYTFNYGVQYKDDLFDARLHCRSQGEMKDTDWNAAGYPEITYPTFTVVDLTAGVTFLEHHKCILKIDNLFDEYYYEKKGYPKPGRAFYVSYRYEF